jgi:hypothetical protein
MTTIKDRRRALLLVVGTATTLLAATLVTGFTPPPAAANTPAATAAATTATPTATVAGCTTWPTAPSDYTNNRWFAAGIAEIKNAATPAEATDAAHAWLAEVRKDPNLLAGAAKYFIQRDVDKATLSTDACATDAAVQLVAELELAIGQAKAIVPDAAPANGTNTGVDNGNVVGSPVAGITGDRKAIKVTLSNGREIWVMARCGNIVTVGPSPVPPGRTDQQPPTVTPPRTTPVCPPGTVGVPPNCLQAKDPSQDPARKGNAPVGGGKNVDPGPGPTTVPTQPPAAPYVAPAPPTPAPAPPVKSTPDPAPAPAPEPSAAPSTDPVGGTSCAPGIPVC